MTQITDIRKNFLGTAEFQMKLDNMRKSQEFTVYPIQANEGGKQIKIQSDTRIGIIDLTTGEGLMSQPHSSGAYFVHLQIDKKTKFQLSPLDLASLRAFIFVTASAHAGIENGVMTCDNSQAIAVLDK